MHHAEGEAAVRRILGLLALAKKYGAASADDACAMALESGVCTYRFVRRYLERNLQLPLNLRQVSSASSSPSSPSLVLSLKPAPAYFEPQSRPPWASSLSS